MTEYSRTPREWKDKMPIIAKCAEEGYRYHRRTMNGKQYMTLRKGRSDKGLGRWSEEKERMLSALFPNINEAKLHRAPTSGEGVFAGVELFKREAPEDAETYIAKVCQRLPAKTEARTKEQVIACLYCGSKWRIRQSGIAAELLECPLCIAEAEQK